MKRKNRLMDAQQMARTLTRIAHEIIENNRGVSDTVLVGIRRRGEPLARMIADAMERVEGTKVPVGTLDITYYRDDMTHVSEDPSINASKLPFEISGKTVVLVDDVLYTGRTVRAALDALTREGRADRIRLAVLIDRGHRELPIRADFVGKNIPTASTEFVRVCLDEIDGETSVWLYDR